MLPVPGHQHRRVPAHHGRYRTGLAGVLGLGPPPDDAIDLKSQLRGSRQKLLQLSFEDFEREVRTVLDGLLGPEGFDVNEDILAITVNRWPHGYSYEYMDLWDPDFAEGEAPHEIARRPFGAITIANSDAGASAYTHVAIDQAWRALANYPMRGHPKPDSETRRQRPARRPVY